MQPATVAVDWNVPPIESIATLAHWLGVTVAQLESYSGINRRVIAKPTLRSPHYHYRLQEKRRGGIRIIEAPQARLKSIQRQILAEILERVPTYYRAAHGFVTGRSVVTYAEPHIGQHVVLRMDLQEFFPSIGGPRIQAIFRMLGYPESVADLLGGLCTNATPPHVFVNTVHSHIRAETLSDAQRVYRRSHLPQGAPSSPALANMCAYRLDCRLTGLADWAGAVYTRYADDLAFSGGEEFARHVQRYATQIAVIVREEGWSIQHHKTRVMRRGVRQQLASLVVNERLNVSRAAFDALKATLTNCVRHGPTGQNREGHPDFRAHLIGRVGWVTAVNPAKGHKLQLILAQISWTGG